MRNRDHYMSLPYNPKLRDRARELRKAGNLCEALLWGQLRNKILEVLTNNYQTEAARGGELPNSEFWSLFPQKQRRKILNLPSDNCLGT